MNWIEGISEAIKYIEANLMSELSIDDTYRKGRLRYGHFFIRSLE